METVIVLLIAGLAALFIIRRIYEAAKGKGCLELSGNPTCKCSCCGNRVTCEHDGNL